MKLKKLYTSDEMAKVGGWFGAYLVTYRKYFGKIAPASPHRARKDNHAQ